MDQQRAKVAAVALQQYWAARGRTIQAVVLTEYAAAGDGSRFCYTVRTIPPMVNGYPQLASPTPLHWRDTVKQLVKGTDK